VKIAEMLVQNGEKHDDILHMKSGPVNIRLYKSNKKYRSIIKSIVDYMKAGANIDFEDYPEAQGISGANVGIPFNIVIVVTEDKEEVFLNPVVKDFSLEETKCTTNCGSVNLDEPIKVWRRRWVEVEYYDLQGEKHCEKFRIGDDKPVASATLQHEIEHNLGILIIDKERAE